MESPVTTHKTVTIIVNILETEIIHFNILVWSDSIRIISLWIGEDNRYSLHRISSAPICLSLLLSLLRTSCCMPVSVAVSETKSLCLFAALIFGHTVDFLDLTGYMQNVYMHCAVFWTFRFVFVFAGFVFLFFICSFPQWKRSFAYSQFTHIFLTFIHKIIVITSASWFHVPFARHFFCRLDAEFVWFIHHFHRHHTAKCAVRCRERCF